MELLDWMQANEVGPIIKSVFALSFLCYYIWLRISSRIARQKNTVDRDSERRALVVSVSVARQSQLPCNCSNQNVMQPSHREIMLHLIDVRERLANIEGRLGAPTPRMSAVSPPLEEPAEAPPA